MKAEKIGCFIDSLDPGGAETIAVEICRELAERGYTPEIYHFGNSWIESKCTEYHIPSVIVPGRRYYTSAATLPVFVPLFVSFLARRRIDVLHSHLFGAVVAGSMAACLMRKPHVGTIHDIYTLQENPRRADLLRLSALLGTKLVAVSQSINAYLRRAAAFSEKTLITIGNGVNVTRKTGQDHSLKEKLNIEAGDFVIMSVGRLVEIKGHDTLIAAFHLIVCDRRPVKLFIVGDGPLKSQYEEEVKQQGAEKFIRVLGHRDDVHDLLRLAHLFVLPSLSEGLSCSIIEAMSLGLPVVATDVGGNCELVRHGESGYLVPVANPEALAGAISLLINNDAIREGLSARASEMSRNFSMEAMVDRYVAIYRELTGKHMRTRQSIRS